MSQVKGILWDNDGVLVSTEHLFYDINREVFLEHGIDLSPQQFFDWFLTENCGAWHLLHEKGYTEDQTRGLRAARNARYSVQLANLEISAIPGVQELVARLAPRVPMGIVTSSNREHFELVHNKLAFLSHFQFVLTEESYVESKPSPEPYLLGLKKLGLAASECLVIEDSPRGLRAAMAAGIRCIVLRDAMMMGYGFEGAYRVVDTVAELEAEIEALLAG